jgi:hypothetical protein
VFIVIFMPAGLVAGLGALLRRLRGQRP